jgi:hypothetical protein
MKICTKAKAAKLLNVSRATIYAMIERGELVPNELDYVDIDQLPPNCDYSKPGRKRKEKNAVGKTADAHESSPLVTTDYRAHLEKTINELKRELETTQQQLSKERDRKSRRLLLQESAQLIQDSLPARSTQTKTSTISQSNKMLLEAQIRWLEQENTQLKAENQALRAAVGKSTLEEYLVTTYTSEVYKRYDPNPHNQDEDMEKEFGTSTRQNTCTEERLTLN